MNPAPNIPATTSRPASRHESSDIHFGGIMVFVGLVVLLVFLVLAGMRATLRYFNRTDSFGQRRSNMIAVSPVRSLSVFDFPAPREQIAPRVDLQAFKSNEDAELNLYGWVDRKAGVVRIPIARAMEFLSQTNRPKTNNMAAASSVLDIQQQRPLQTESLEREERK